MELSDQTWNKLVSECSSLEDYVRILISFSEDNIFSYGRNEIISEYTKSVAIKHPDISGDIRFILDLFLFKSKTIITENRNTFCKLF